MSRISLLDEIPTGDIQLQYYVTRKLPEHDGILRWNFTQTTSDSSTILFNKYECTGHQVICSESAIIVRRWMILITTGDSLEGFKKYCSNDCNPYVLDDVLDDPFKPCHQQDTESICRMFLCKKMLRKPPRYGFPQVPPKELIARCHGIDDVQLDIITCNYLPLEPFIKSNNIGAHGKADIHQWIRKYATSTVRAGKLDLGHIRCVDNTVNLVHFVRGAESCNILDLVNRAYQSATYYFNNAPMTQTFIRDMIVKEPVAAGVRLGYKAEPYIGYMLIILTNKYKPEKGSPIKMLSIHSRLILIALCNYLRELSIPLSIQFAESD
jgi:hypothetical protein